MPVYAYECDVCGTQFDMRRRLGEPHPTSCPAGHERVHRIFAPPTIIFKGSGFYATDHGRNGRTSRRTSDNTESTDSPKPESSTETKGEEIV